MSEKLDGLREKLSHEKANDPLIHIVTRAADLLSAEHSSQPYYIPDTDPVEYVLAQDALPLSEEVVRLRRIKDFVSALSGAVSEYTKDVEIQLFEVMGTKGPTGFKHMGQNFSMSSTKYVQADKEQGGTANPNLKAWLRDNDMPDVAEGTINANTLKSAVTTWLNDHPIEATQQVGADHVPLEGAELLAALDITQEALDVRIAEHDRLLTMVNIHSEPSLSVKKV